jgi:NAD+ kinase
VVAGTDALVAVPVAPFTVDPHRWVVDAPLTLTVTRDEGTVELLVDGHERGRVEPADQVRVGDGGALTVVDPTGSDRMEKT